MNSIFKANDIRGVYPEELDESIVFRIAHAIGSHLSEKSAASGAGKRKKKAVIVVGHDARLSSPVLYKAVIDGIMNRELGIRANDKKSIIRNSKFIIHKAGLMTTPMLYFLVSKYKAAGGIMVTASHNPKRYNGLKVVTAGARPVSGKEVERWTEKFSAQ